MNMMFIITQVSLLLKRGFLIPYPFELKSNYYEMPNNILNNIAEHNDDNTEIKETIFIGKMDLIKRNFIDLAKKKLFSIEPMVFNDTIYMVEENLPQLNWNTDYKDTLSISDHMCKKATVNFRGRHYVAWYDPDIPISFGPWKFNNLPGLAFEIYDETHRYEWVLTRIKKISIDEESLNNQKAQHVLSLKTFINRRAYLFQEKRDQLKKNIRTRSERGVNVTKVKVEKSRTGRELVFEWE
jgi:GLPGLI family protein